MGRGLLTKALHGAATAGASIAEGEIELMRRKRMAQYEHGLGLERENVRSANDQSNTRLNDELARGRAAESDQRKLENQKALEGERVTNEGKLIEKRAGAEAGLLTKRQQMELNAEKDRYEITTLDDGTRVQRDKISGKIEPLGKATEPTYRTIKNFDKRGNQTGETIYRMNGDQMITVQPAGSEQQAQASQIPPPNQREVNKEYTSPSGRRAIWTGEGWKPIN